MNRWEKPMTIAPPRKERGQPALGSHQSQVQRGTMAVIIIQSLPPPKKKKTLVGGKVDWDGD